MEINTYITYSSIINIEYKYYTKDTEDLSPCRTIPRKWSPAPARRFFEK